MLRTAAVANPVRSFIETRSIRSRRSWLVIAVVYGLLVSTLALSDSGPVVPEPQVRGEVVMLTSELIVVESAGGTNILIPIGKHIPVDASLQVDDQVEIVATPDRQVTSVKKTTP